MVSNIDVAEKGAELLLQSSNYGVAISNSTTISNIGMAVLAPNPHLCSNIYAK